MAKSLRSKWRRKCRAVKRERYGAKELERLKKTLGMNDDGTKDIEMSEISEIATVVDAKKIKESAKAVEDTEDNDVKAVENTEDNDVKAVEDTEENSAKTVEDTEKMEVDTVRRVYNKRTMQDQFGNYPVWMNNRKIAKHKKGRAKSQKANTKFQKRLTRRQKKLSKRN